MSKRHSIYLVPGPCELYSEDFAALSSNMMPHYGSSFLEQWNSIRSGVALFMGTKHVPIGVPAIGTVATEMAASIFSERHCIVINTGFFSERIAEILTAHRCKVTMDNPKFPNDIANPARLERVIRNNPTADAVFVVHSESSTGILHPIKELSKITRTYGKLLAVDGISSIGATKFHMDEWGVDILWTASHKALASPPGLSFVSLSAHAVEFAKWNRSNIKTWILDPNVWLEYEKAWDWHPYPCTIPAPVVAVLYSYLQRVSKIDHEYIFAKHSEAAKQYRKFMSCYGFYPLTRDLAYSSPTVSVFSPVIQNFNVEEFIVSLRDKFGIWVAGGIGKLHGKVVRIGHMGRTLEIDRRKYFFSAAHNILSTAGMQCNKFGSN